MSGKSSYLLGIAPDREPELVDHAGRAASVFGQKCIFLERRGTAFLVYPPDTPDPRAAVAPLIVSEPPPTAYNLDQADSINPNEARFVVQLRQRIADGDDYLTVLDLALGPVSPLLRGASFATAEVQRRAAYKSARNLVTEYGQKLGLLRRASDERDSHLGLIVRDSAAAYDPWGPKPSGPSVRPACISQYRAARLLGWSLDQVRGALAAGGLRGLTIDGALVIEAGSITTASGHAGQSE